MIHSLFAVAAVVSTIAGVPGTSGYLDGAANVALFNKPTEITLDAVGGDVYVVDRLNNAVRKVSAGSVSTFLKSPTLDFGGPMGGGIVIEPAGLFRTAPLFRRKLLIAASGANAIFDAEIAVNSILESPIEAGTDGSTHWHFSTPTALATDRRHSPTNCCPYNFVYVADTGNGTIRKLSRQLDAELESYHTLSADTFARGFVAPRGLAFGPDGSLYVADAGQHAIIRVMPDGTSFVVAGKPFNPGNADGVPGQLNTPTGIDVDDAGNVYIADTANSTIRRLRADGVLETVAGSPGEAGFVDGDARIARFNGPVGIQVAADGKSLIVADTSNHVIRKITFIPPPPEVPRRRTVGH